MKQTCIILLVISIVLVFTACRGSTQLPAGSIASTAATECQTIAITEGEHPVEKSQLNFYMDGHEASANAVLFSFEGYSIYILEDSQGGMGGTNADGHMIDTQIISAESATYILIKKYAMENAEIAGTYLTVMADTFELT